MSETTVTTTEQTTVVETIEQTVVVQAITPEGTELVETEQGTTVVEVRVQGPQGPAGPTGADGADGLAGENGLSAYEVALENGFVGTEAAWLASLIGPQGPAGPEGDQGPPGADGADGSDATVNATNVASVVHAASAKSPPVDSDEFPIADSAASYGLKKVLWSAIKSALSAATGWLAPAALTQAGATTGQAMTWNGTAWAPSTIAATPAGSGAELQYRNSGAFGAAAVTHYDATNGRLSIGAGTSPSAVLHTQSDNAAEIVGIDQAAASQTASLREWRNSAGNLLSRVRHDGAMTAPRFYLNDTAAPSTPTYLTATADGYGVSIYSRYSSSDPLIELGSWCNPQLTRTFSFGGTYHPLMWRNPLSLIPDSRTLNATGSSTLAGYPIVFHGAYGGAYAGTGANANWRNGSDFVFWAGFGAQSPTSGENGGNAGRHLFFTNAGGAGNGAGAAGSDGEFVVATWDNTAKGVGTYRFRVRHNGSIYMGGLPTSNPGVAGWLWNDGGTLKIS